MRVRLNGEILLARDRNRGVQVSSELINTYEHPAPQDIRTFFSKRDGDQWGYANNSRQAHLSRAVAAYSVTFPDVKGKP